MPCRSSAFQRAVFLHFIVPTVKIQKQVSRDPPRANQAAAFFRMSRSIRSRLISRFARRNSWRSNVVSPSLRRPSSRSACMTQFRIADAEGSNSRASDSGVLPERTSPTISNRNAGGYRRCFLAIVDPSFLPLLWKCPRKRVNSTRIIPNVWAWVEAGAQSSTAS